jgi:hypothetical protein
MALCWWLIPVTVATQEAELLRIAVQSQPGETFHGWLWKKSNYIPKMKLTYLCNISYTHDMQKFCVCTRIPYQSHP